MVKCYNCGYFSRTPDKKLNVDWVCIADWIQGMPIPKGVFKQANEERKCELYVYKPQE
jgi:hypothetical protein